nr:hypothetical protein [Kibdelosporangium sp. MJ126-NF4]CEL13057.1 hypothetical protein [Kibdelosporangium sp. MJ126-NF4]CTQ98744.1 hypothetical protein [Kibdelosporangium sp. MJ126-NF4]
MDGYQAEFAEFDTAAGVARSAAEQVAGVDLKGSMTQAKAGMPGSISEQSMGRLADSWLYARVSWEQSAVGYADGLGISKRSYQNNEQAAAADFGGHGR